MHKLTAFPEGAGTLLVEGKTRPCQVVFGNMVLLLKLVPPMRIGTLRSPVTESFGLPIPAHLRLLLVYAGYRLGLS